MFSTRPRTGTFTFANIVAALRASMSATSCGVVTMIAPAEHRRDARAVHVAIAQADARAVFVQRDGEVRGDRRFADAALSARDGDDVFDAGDRGRTHARGLRRRLDVDQHAHLADA